MEAGLRSGNKYSPFPEEMNRKLTGGIASIHFAPTIRGFKNLIKEGVEEKDIFITGNTVIDALLETVEPDYQFADPLLKDIPFNEKKVLLVTAHRRENLGKPMENIFSALAELHNNFKISKLSFLYTKTPGLGK